MLKNKFLKITLSIVIILILFIAAVNEFKPDYFNNIISNQLTFDTNQYETAAVQYLSAKSASGVASNAVMDTVEEMEEDYSAVFLEDNDKGNNRKIIKNYSLNIETLKFDETYSDILSKITENNGVVDNSSINNNSINSERSRYLSMNVRIPIEKVDGFIEYMNNKFNVTYRSESQEDITDIYDDTTVRLENLKLEEKKLQELIPKTNKVEELIQVQDRLSTINSEIKRLENRKNNYDKKINYSNIFLSVTEVKNLTDTSDSELPNRENILSAFHQNFNDTILFLKKSVIFIFVHIPFICMVLILILILLLIINHDSSKKDNSNIDVGKGLGKSVIKNDRGLNKKIGLVKEFDHKNVIIRDDTKVNNNISHDDMITEEDLNQ